MHIRWDWETGLIKPYNHVSTLCGRKVVAHNASVPDHPDRWCTACIRGIGYQLSANLELAQGTMVESYYEAVRQVVEPLQAALRKQQNANRGMFTGG